MKEDQRREVLDIAAEAAMDAIEDLIAGGIVHAESEEDFGELLFEAIDKIFRDQFGITDLTRSEVGTAYKRLAARHGARADQHGAMEELYERGAAEIERAATLQGMSADQLTVGEAVEIIRLHGEDPDPVVVAALNVEEEVPEERREEGE